MAIAKKPHIPDFRAVRRTMMAVSQEVTERRVAEFAEHEREVFVSRIKSQDFDSFDANPLSDRYRRWKLARGLDPRIMIRTGNYVDHIRVWRERIDRHTLGLRVGFHPRLLARDAKGQRITGLLMSTIAWVHERGSAKLPDLPVRPHWGPHFREMHERSNPLRASIKTEIRKRAKAELPGVL